MRVTSEIVLPELGENIEVAEVSAVLVSVGDTIRRDQPVIEVETEKASLEVPTSTDGTVKQLYVNAGDTVEVGQLILVVESAVDRAEPPSSPMEPLAQPLVLPPETAAVPREIDRDAVRAATQPADPQIGDEVPAAPSVRALARELGVDVHEVPGSGPGGRISRADVKTFARHRIAGGSSSAAAKPQRTPPDYTKWGEVSREPLTRIRRTTAEKLAHAWSSVPHVTQFDRSDITELEAARQEFNRRDRTGPKLTVTAVLLDVVARALRSFPRFNASLDLTAGEVVLKKYVHIGVAVDTERGLLVPVVRDVDRKSLLEVAADVAGLAARARERKLTPDEMAGASFTVSNLGGLGTTYFSPIVNWPEVAILGLGRAEQQVMFADEMFRPRLMLPLSLSYDHRLNDGADAARFLRRIAEELEGPARLPAESGGWPVEFKEF